MQTSSLIAPSSLTVVFYLYARKVGDSMINYRVVSLVDEEKADRVDLRSIFDQVRRE